MAANSEQQNSRCQDSLKRLYLARDHTSTGEIEYFPCFYAEARVDFNDVRTGFRETRSLCKVLEIYAQPADLFWAHDMVRDVDPSVLLPAPPPGVRLNPLPEFVDGGFISLMETQCIQYLLRAFVARLYKNSVLNVYSSPGESIGEFKIRCMELLESPLRKELDLAFDVFNRRLKQLKEKYLSPHDFSGATVAQCESRNRDTFSCYADRITAYFMQGIPRCCSEPMAGSPQGGAELEEILIGMEFEVQKAIHRIRESYEEKAGSLDEYIVHPNLKDIHFVRSGIVWMPRQAV